MISKKKRDKKELSEKLKLNTSDEISADLVIGKSSGKRVRKENVMGKASHKKEMKLNNENVEIDSVYTRKTTKSKNKSNTTNNISIESKMALLRGNGRACVATHANGCRHYGILDLGAMDSKNFLYYNKTGGWLNGKCCCNCRLDVNEMKMDKATKGCSS